LGSWMSEKIPGVEFITEQQLRRYKLDDLPDWVPNNSINHEFRHDGYTRVTSQKDGKSQIISYEVEISEKSLKRYEQLIRYCRYEREPAQVCWLGPQKSNAKSSAPW